MNYLSLQNRYKDLINNNLMSNYQKIIVAICFILNMNDGIDVLIVSFSGSDIIKEWSLSKAEMGYIFSSGLVGMTLGCFFLAPLGDKIGRRKVFIIALILISSGMLLVGVCSSYLQLLAFRFITGIGIGGVLPTLAATASEFSNNKRRDFNVGLVQAGWPVGAIMTGLFCAYAIPHFGWRYAFLFAGFISLIMLVMVIFYMSNSVEFLIKKQPPNALNQLNNLLNKIGQEDIKSLPKSEESKINKPVSLLFLEEYKNSTFKLWIAAFFGFLTLYTLMSWVPNIAKESGLPFEMATYVGITLNIGAIIGTLSLGFLSDKYGLKKVVVSFMICAFGVMLIYGNITLTTAIIFLLIGLIGIFVQGGFNGMYPILARIYPTEIRTTGVGLAVGVGRFGAILGPTLFGYLFDSGLSISNLFTLFSLPLLVTGLCVWNLKSKNLK